MHFEIAIVGLGPAGIFSLAFLPEDKIEKTLILEHKTIGGDIAANYGGIRANISNYDIVTAFRKIPRWREENKPLTFLKRYEDSECPFLHDVCKQMREWIAPDIKRAHFYNRKMTNIIESEKGWKLETEQELFETQKLILCIGASAKKLDLPKATVPLSLCLTKSQLEQHISERDTVVVFGTAHSGTLIMKNLYEIGCKNVTGIYKGDSPFFYARDGHLGGIKQESAIVADQILNKEWSEKTPNLISINDFSKVYRTIEKADVVLYSIGYEKPTLYYVDKTGVKKSFVHNPSSGTFDNVNNVWGYGIAFPSYKQDTEFPDIGFNGFITAIQRGLFPTGSPL